MAATAVTIWMNAKASLLVETHCTFALAAKPAGPPFEAKPEFGHAVFLCGPDVATVEIRRKRGGRTADVRVGPGWLSVVSTKDDPAEVLAFTARGLQTFSWIPPGKAA